MQEHEIVEQPRSGWKMSRRSLLAVALPAAGAGLLAACSPAAPAAPTAKPAAATTAPAAAAPTVAAPVSAPAAAGSPAPAASPVASQGKPGGILRVGQVGDIARLDGQLYTAVHTTWMPYDRLTAYDDKQQPQPMLAESWEVASDFKQIKLNLRKGVTFHTGREFTSADIKWNIEYVRSPKVAAGALVQQSNWYQSIETPDKYTVILKSDRARPLAFDFFEFFDIVDREAMEGPAPESKSVGTGPFVFKEWAVGDHLTFEKNKNYWRPNRPFLDGVSVQIFRDAQAMVTAMEAGSLDAVIAPPLRDYDRLKKDSKFAALTVPSGTNVIGANTTLPPTDNKFLRQAINFAVDRKRIAESVYLNVGEPKDLIWATSSPAYDPAKAAFYTFDLDKSKALIAQSGLSNIAFDIVTTTSNAELSQAALIIQGDLQKVGITASIRPYDVAAYLDQINNHKYTGTYMGGVAYVAASPGTIIANSRHLDPQGNSNTGYTSAKYVELYNAVTSEPDVSKMKTAYNQLNDLLLDESAVMPICGGPDRMLTTAKVHDIAGSSHGAFIYNDAWKDA